MTAEPFAARLAELPAPPPTLGCSCGVVQAGANHRLHFGGCASGEPNPKYVAHQRLIKIVDLAELVKMHSLRYRLYQCKDRLDQIAAALEALNG